ncbi:aspartate/glutamate racemase family protein [Amycolatopsis lurida]
MRILWQSYTAPGTEYHEAMLSRLQQVASPGTTIEMSGLLPPDRYVHRLSELRCAYQVLAQTLEVAESGYDAIVVGHFQDGGVHELRAACEIPVVGLGEAVMHQAMMLGDAFGLVTINPGFSAWHRAQVRSYRLDGKFAGVEAMDTSAEVYFAAFQGDIGARESVVSQFRDRAQRLIDRGADVIIPAGGLPALLLRTISHLDLGDVTLLDPLGVAVLQAEMWYRLGKDSGLRPGRSGSYALPEPGVIKEIIDSVRPLDSAGSVLKKGKS